MKFSFSKALAVLLLAWSLVAAVPALGGPPATAQAPDCGFVLGFATLRDLVGAKVTGDCLEDQRFAANGNAEQRTTGGLLVWRKADNWTAFTDGYQTWINGPMGLQTRLNAERFEWEAPLPDWESLGPLGPTGAPEAVRRLFTPASGAFFAQTGEGLYRSDDAGATWRSVTLPPQVDATSLAQGIAVDPNNHAVVYAASRQGLYKSEDDAASWRLVLPLDERAYVLAVAVSPVESAVVYVALSNGEFHRSRDGGGTWTRQVPPPAGGPCAWSAPLLAPHPTDARRLARTFGCYAGRNLVGGIPVSHSTDQGDTWQTLVVTPGTSPGALAGGQGMAPHRYYLTQNLPATGGGGALLRSDDDGATWQTLLVVPVAPSGAPPGATFYLGALTYDPRQPDRVWLGRTGQGSGVMASADGGATWRDLGRQDIGRVSHLALGIDGLNLFAATDRGVWRLRLGES